MGRKVAELEGAELDYWVARADREHPESEVHIGTCRLYSTRWDCGGPIIEREGIQIGPFNGHWAAAKSDGDAWGDTYCDQNGKSPLEAAMRCYVAFKFGDEVPE